MEGLSVCASMCHHFWWYIMIQGTIYRVKSLVTYNDSSVINYDITMTSKPLNQSSYNFLWYIYSVAMFIWFSWVWTIGTVVQKANFVPCGIDWSRFAEFFSEDFQIISTMPSNRNYVYVLFHIINYSMYSWMFF